MIMPYRQFSQHISLIQYGMPHCIVSWRPRHHWAQCLSWSAKMGNKDGRSPLAYNHWRSCILFLSRRLGPASRLLSTQLNNEKPAFAAYLVYAGSIICSNTEKETPLIPPPTVVSMPWCPPYFGWWMIGLKNWKAVEETRDSSKQFPTGRACQPCLIFYEWGGWC